MPTERDVALTAAQAHLRLGKLELAIAEYRHVLLMDPTDHATAVLLAHLYRRAGQATEAQELMQRAADILMHRGLETAATAVERRLLAASQNDETALLEAAERAAAEGRTADAATYRAAAARGRASHPEDTGAATVPSGGDPDAAAGLRAHLARVYVAMGDAPRAAEYLTASMAPDDAPLVLTIGEIQLRAGRADEALATIETAARMDAALAPELARLGLHAARHCAPDVAFRIVDLAVDLWLAQSQGMLALTALQSLQAIVPHHAATQRRAVDVKARTGDAEAATSVIPFTAAAGLRAARNK